MEPILKRDTRGAAIIRSIANGGTLKAAGDAIGVSSTRAGQILRIYCRQIGLPGTISEIKSRPFDYLNNLEKTTEIDRSTLTRNAIHNLVYKLKLKSAEELTPKYLSNVTASQLLGVGVTFVTISDLQGWLKTSGHSLKRHPPESANAITAIKRAINLLEAFYFDISLINEQFDHFDDKNG